MLPIVSLAGSTLPPTAPPTTQSSTGQPSPSPPTGSPPPPTGSPAPSLGTGKTDFLKITVTGGG